VFFSDGWIPIVGQSQCECEAGQAMDEAAEAFVVGRWADSAGEFTIKNGDLK
jgi:hypothetical protein